MKWEYPWILWGLSGIPILTGLFFMLGRRKKAFWKTWGTLPFIRKQSLPLSTRRDLLKACLFLTGFALAVIGFASPLRERSVWEPFWENVAVVILMDFSKSMDAPRDPHELNAPSRFMETKQSILEFLSSLPKGVKVSVVPFSEYAIPITSGFSEDHGEIIAKVRRIHRDFFYKQGTEITTALRHTFGLVDTFVKEWENEGMGGRENGRLPILQKPVASIIMISDGDQKILDDLRELLAERGKTIPVFTIGVGSEVPVPIPDALSPVGYLVDQKGSLITTALNVNTLKFIAEQTGGTYYAFEKRGELFAALRDIIEKQGTRSQHQYTYTDPLRHFFFLGSFFSLLIFWKFDDF